MVRFGNFNGRRLVVRRVDEDLQAELALAAAQETNKISLRCAIGGTVCNRYGYPASTEAVLTCAFPTGQAIQILSRIAANKATRGGGAGVCCYVAGAPSLRPVWDHRYNDESKRIAKEKFLAWAATQID